MDNSSRASNSQNESEPNNISTNNITITVEEESPSTNKIIDYYTELPEPAIVRIPHSPKNQVFDEIPPPPYHVDMRFPIQSHSRDSTTSPPEYTASIITTQPLSIPSPSFHNINESQPLHPLKSCKICQESDEDDNDNNGSYHKGKLISPCKCRGSLQYVHTGCLNKWRYSNVRSDASYRCEVCKYEYKFYRPHIAKIFSSYFTLHILSLLILFITIYFVSFMVNYIATHSNNNPSIPPSPLPPENSWKDTKILNIKGLHWLIGTSIISLFGLMFFMFMVCCNGFRHTRNTFCYCGGCSDGGGSYYPSGSCSGGFIGCDGGSGDCDCAGFCVVIFLLMMLVLFFIGCLGAIIAAYLFIQKITNVCLERIHDQILEVKKD